MQFRQTMIAAGFALLLAASSSQALTLDFEEFGHGDIITSSQGVAIATTNLSAGPDLGVAFDTMRINTADQDLQFFSPNSNGGENG
jgi:hypothetical protein